MEEKFTYTYSAKEQEEIKRIREKYAPQEETPMERLRRLDRSATKAASVLSLTLGIVSVLIMGVGMCCTMLPDWKRFFVLGIVVGVVGIAGILAAYPIYNYMVKRKRAKLAPEILRLADELME